MQMKIKDIQITFFVRGKLDQKRVQFFHDRRKAGEKLEKVIVDADTKELIDGRHRISGAEKFGDTEIDVEFRKYKNQEERIAAALQANAGGALPPSNDDIYHVIEYLFSLKVPRKKIVALVAESLGVNEKFVQNAVNWVLSRLKKIQIKKAADAVVEGTHNVKSAAEHFGVNEEDVRLELNGERKKKRPRNDIGIHLTNLLNGTSRQVGGQLNTVQKSVADGEMSMADARAIVEQVQRKLKNMIRNNSDWLRRFEQAGKVPEAADRLGKQRAKTKRHKEKKSGSSGGSAGSGQMALSAMGLGDDE